MQQIRGAKRTSQQRLTTVTLNDGTKAIINPKKLSGMTRHHGTASDGTKVNSLSSKMIGKSIVIKNDQGQTFTCSIAELEVMAKQIFSNQLDSSSTTS